MAQTEPAATGERYARQSVLPMIRAAGQQRLADSAVLIVGCGALGSVQAELTARAGVGRLIVVDRDILELHNLHRQILFTEQDVRDRLPKAEAAARHLRAINSEIAIEAVTTDVTPANVEALVQRADLVLDGTDNFETRYLLNDCCVKLGKPWVYGGVLGSDGTVMAVQPGQGPCLRCIFPEPPDASTVPTCETRGVLNTAVMWVAALEVTEGMKILVADPAAQVRLYALDIWGGTFASVTPQRNDECPCCGQRQFGFLTGKRGSSSTVFCGRNAVQVTPERPVNPDFGRLTQRLNSLGRTTMNGLVLEFETDKHRLVVFPDGRVLVLGTTNPTEARGLVAKYIGS
ncbi:MAG: thiazole biosynthesis adenylyltransferase ThiF [Candidatus Anammoximicrobium sp.]|nr:thiazole biosynthesis adenylyltransferase ThiF [Candidatus Anammoximicrobium sp.]